MIDWRQFLTSDPQVCLGQPRKGTRVFVTNILDSLAEGATRDEILRELLVPPAGAYRRGHGVRSGVGPGRESLAVG